MTMPTLSSAFSVRHLSLPSFSDADLTVVDRVSVKDVSDSELQGNNMLKSLYLASRMIRSWNFVDAEGKPLEISVETLSAFPVEDVNFLIEQVVIPAVQKKTD